MVINGINKFRNNQNISMGIINVGTKGVNLWVWQPQKVIGMISIGYVWFNLIIMDGWGVVGFS